MTKKQLYIGAFLDGYFSDKHPDYGLSYFDELYKAERLARKKWHKHKKMITMDEKPYDIVDLEYFYNYHYRTERMMDWSELSEKQKMALEKSREYQHYFMNKTIHECRKEFEKLIAAVNRFMLKSK